MMDRSKRSFARSKFDSNHQVFLFFKNYKLTCNLWFNLTMKCCLIDQNRRILTTNCRFCASSIQVSIVSFCFYTETARKHETWTKHKRLRWPVRFVCFNKWKGAETVINCHIPATRCKLCYIAKSKQLSYRFAIKTIKHKISKVFTVTSRIWTCSFRSTSQVVQFIEIQDKKGPYVLQNCCFRATRCTRNHQNKAQYINII